jgi:hypothetical protein
MKRRSNGRRKIFTATWKDTKTKQLEGTISQAQLRELIEREGKMLSLGFAEVVKRAKKGTLPRNAIGDDLSLLVQLLPA